jgi:hypothetical protein
MALVGVAGLAASAQVSQAPTSWRSSQPLLRIPEPAEVSTLYATGEQILIDTFEMRWRPMCFNQSPMNMQQLRASQQSHDAQFAPGQPITVVDAPRTGRMSNVNIVFNLGGSVPAAAIPSFAAAEAYLEAQFADPITVTVSVSFANLGSGIIGATGSSYANNRSYTNVRDGLVAGMDANDTIQTSLPAGTTIPVRYVGTSATVTNESLIDMTRANFKAAIGTTTGSDGSMQYNSSFNFDYDPSNGITGSQTSLVDVIIHETGHAMGFVSAADSTTGGQMDTLTSSASRPPTAPATTTPTRSPSGSTKASPRRLQHPQRRRDQHIDLVSVEYKMSDGTPYQARTSASRPRTSASWILRSPRARPTTPTTSRPRTPACSTRSAGTTRPRAAAAASVLTITDDPDSETVCEGDNVVLAVATTGSAATYEWRKNFVVIPGETGDTLTLTSVTEADEGSYICVVDNECSSPQLSAAGVITVNAATDISDDPDSQTVDVGDPVSLSVTATGTNIEYQWKKDTLDIGGATGATYNIASAATGDAGSYTCLVTGDCGSVTSAAALLTVNDDTPPCAADYNGDTEGDVLDFLDFMDDFGTCENQPAPCGLFGGDFNGDTFIDVLDFLDFLDAFGVGCG